MPKFKREISALKRARKLFSRSESSDSEESDSSHESGEHSHIPIKFPLPLIENLEISSEMEQLTHQLASIMQQLKELNENQNRQQRVIDNLQNVAPAVAPAEQQNHTGVNLEHLYKIPDPIKSLPVFEGNRKQLSAWLTTAENTLNLFKDRVNDTLFNMYVTAVTNKIQGKAKDIICLAGNPQDFNAIKEILTNALGDRQELSTYKCQLWQNHMSDGMSVQKYYQRTKDLVQNIKTLAKQKEIYKNSWQAINEFIDEDCLAAFIAGLREPYFGYAQAARPNDIEDAYAFLCKFKSKELTAACMSDKLPSRKLSYQNQQKFKNQNQQNSTFSEKTFKRNSENSEKPEFKSSTTPMEIDPSIRSRLTLNKKLINNQELDSEHDSESENESEQEVAVNFQMKINTQNET